LSPSQHPAGQPMLVRYLTKNFIIVLFPEPTNPSKRKRGTTVDSSLSLVSVLSFVPPEAVGLVKTDLIVEVIINIINNGLL